MSYLEALQDALAAEHAAVYVTGALGAQTSQSAQPTLYGAFVSAYRAHRDGRDRLVALVRGLNAQPVVAEVAYELGADLGDVTVLARRALNVERACASAYAALVASSTGSDRRWPLAQLEMTAVRELAFRGTPEIFPGSDEYADR